ncbi:hypothetical protein DPMN_056202 [Dreissena polymorpha]|uniref:Uncharacterized protein n=1 Tax=Dreissena polymorpha TaxID=45954 RepID=A0A9D4CU03_DREPO|nr:hypothetical protein DPMN_056202 [Dreissena polymorpha]
MQSVLFCQSEAYMFNILNVTGVVHCQGESQCLGQHILTGLPEEDEEDPLPSLQLRGLYRLL